MKVLMLSPYITLNSHFEFTRNKTGFGYMVFDIARNVGKLETVDLLITDVRHHQFYEDSVNFLGSSFGKIVVNLFHCLPLSSFISLVKKYKILRRTAIRLLYYWLLTGYVSTLVKKGNYDIVHIHGCGFYTDIWMQVCKRVNQKFIVTLHGLNSFSDTVGLEAAGKRYERDFLKRAVDGEFFITVISTGMKRIIERTFGITNSASIMVVCNSFSFSYNENTTMSIRKKYGIPLEAKILLYVGNISENKNQLQMVEAFDLLPDGLRRQTWVLFCGENHMNDKTTLEYAINNCQNADHLILCGGIEKELMPDYYHSADAVVLLSKTEGFGLSLIEGMHFGLPGLMFTDMDAYEDIYDEKAVIGVVNRTNQCVADGIEQLLKGEWNKKVIKTSSERFESDVMAQRYILVYKRVFA